MQIGTKEIPDELFHRYLRLIKATERCGERYNYDFDKEREAVHNEIMRHINLMPHMKEYRDFQNSLQDLCENMLPSRLPPQQIPKTINPPNSGLMHKSMTKIADKAG